MWYPKHLVAMKFILHYEEKELSCSLAISGCPYFLLCSSRGWSSLCILWIIHNFVYLLKSLCFIVHYAHCETPCSPGWRELVLIVSACRETVQFLHSGCHVLRSSSSSITSHWIQGNKSTRNTGTSQVRPRKAFSFLLHSFSGNSFLFDEAAFLKASGLRASVMQDDLTLSVLFF